MNDNDDKTTTTGAKGKVDLVLIWSLYQDSWWGPNRCGYTTAITSAGVYTRTEAGALVRGSRNEIREISDHLPTYRPGTLGAMLATPPPATGPPEPLRESRAVELLREAVAIVDSYGDEWEWLDERAETWGRDIGAFLDGQPPPAPEFDPTDDEIVSMYLLKQGDMGHDDVEHDGAMFRGCGNDIDAAEAWCAAVAEARDGELPDLLREVRAMDDDAKAALRGGE